MPAVSLTHVAYREKLPPKIINCGPAEFPPKYLARAQWSGGTSAWPPTILTNQFIVQPQPECISGQLSMEDRDRLGHYNGLHTVYFRLLIIKNSSINRIVVTTAQ